MTSALKSLTSVLRLLTSVTALAVTAHAGSMSADGMSRLNLRGEEPMILNLADTGLTTPSTPFYAGPAPLVNNTVPTASVPSVSLAQPRYTQSFVSFDSSGDRVNSESFLAPTSAGPVVNAPDAITVVKTWAPGTTDFNLGTNWSGGLPTSVDIATFTGAAGTQPNVTANISVLGLDFSTSGYVLTSTSPAVLTLLSTGTTNGAAAISSRNTTLTNTISADLNLGAAGGSTQTFLQASGGTLTLGGIISGGGATNTLVLGSTGTINLNGPNTYTGTTQWNAGGNTTVIGNKAAFGTSTINFNQTNTIKAGVDLTGVNKVTNAITLAANPTFQNNLGFNLEFGGNVNMSGGARTITESTGTTTFDGVISNDAGGGLSFATTSSGIFVLKGVNTYTGNSTISGATGSVSVSNIGDSGVSGNLGAGTTINLGNTTTLGTLVYTGTGENTSKVINLNGTTGGATIDQSGASGLLKFTGTNTATGVGSKILTLQGSTAGTGEISGAIVNGSGTTSVTKAGSGTWTLSGTNTYTGGTTLSLGQLNINSTTALGATASTFTISGGTIDNTTAGALTLANNNAQTWNGNFIFTGTQSLNMGTGTVSLGTTAGASRTVTVSANTLTEGGIISDGTTAKTLIKAGAGTLTLLGVNTYSVQTTLTGGTLIAGNNSALGTGTIAFNGGALQGNGTALIFSNAASISSNGGMIGGSTDITFNGSWSESASSALTINNSGPTIINGDFDLASASSRTLTINGTGSLSMTGVLKNTGGTGSLTYSGSNTLTLTNTNTYAGNTSISGGGTISVATIGNSGSNGGVGAGTTINLNNGTLLYTGTGESTSKVINLSGTTGGATIDQSGASGSLNFTSALTATGAGSKTLTLQGSTAGTGEISGAIVDNSGTNVTSLVKAGTGTWTLSGTNTYTGATTVNGGTLLINGSTASGSAVTVTGSGSTLGGTGTVGGGVTVNSGAILEGGNGTTGTALTLNGALTLASSSIIELTLGASNAHSTLARTGAGTWTFDSTQAFTFLNAQAGSYDNIITGLAGDPISEGSWTVTNAGWSATFTFDGGVGPGNIDVVLAPVPEPSTWIGGALALVAVGVTQRKRFAKLLRVIG